MKVSDAYSNLTEEAKRRAISEISTLLKGRGLVRRSRKQSDSTGYVKNILRGNKAAPCGMDVARVVSGYFRGQIGLAVSPEDVIIGCGDFAANESGEPQPAAA